MLKRFLTYCSLLSCLACSKLNYTPAKSPKAFTDPRDGQKYGYVEIDDRYWMTENMRYKVEGSKLNPDNPSPLFGRLYNWEQAMKACPEGWRLSTDIDWMMLEKHFIDGDSLLVKEAFRGQNVKILKSKKDWTTPGTDSLSLNILPAGGGDHTELHSLHTTAFFWTSDSHLVSKFAYYRIISENNEGIYYGITTKTRYFSCRCVKSVEM